MKKRIEYTGKQNKLISCCIHNTKLFMKKLIYTIVIVAFTLISCNNNDNLKPDNQNAVEVIKKNAKAFSSSHDSLVRKMINVENQKIKEKIKSTNEVETGLNLSEVCDVIEEVTGIRPVILGNTRIIKQKSGSDSSDENLSINFNVEKLNLAEYATSGILAEYLGQIDYIRQDSSLTVTDKAELINEIQTKFSKDTKATLSDLEIFYNTTEILKGSMSLWENENSIHQVKTNISGVYFAKPLSEWSFWAKLGFVAGADALGGILGTFAGGIVIVGGVPLYVPSGPAGTVAGAAALSYIASKMVGW